uniref:Uncharacterized protein n=1 Tax=Oryza meridionalis TaxID=40149 RepID=A0A0E0CSX4_9ORYZ
MSPQAAAHGDLVFLRCYCCRSRTPKTLAPSPLGFEIARRGRNSSARIHRLGRRPPATTLGMSSAVTGLVLYHELKAKIKTLKDAVKSG